MPILRFDDDTQPPAASHCHFRRLLLRRHAMQHFAADFARLYAHGHDIFSLLTLYAPLLAAAAIEYMNTPPIAAIVGAPRACRRFFAGAPP